MTKKTSPKTTSRTSSKHPGFQKVAKQIAKKQGIPLKNAQAILASQTRKASPQAKAKNPALKKVKGKAK